MNILIINTGSSSVKYQLINAQYEQVLANGKIDRIGMKDPVLIHQKKGGEEILVKREIPDHSAAMEIVLSTLSEETIDAVGHRIVHGGEKFKDAVVIDESVVEALTQLEALAPLHMAPNIAGVKACMGHLPGVPMAAVFDTAYHQTMPERAYLYGIPLEVYKKHKVRRYGFHGTSHQYVAKRVRQILKRNTESLRIISCHLGNGSSVAAIKYGKVVDTSMGFTPLEGLVMGTRCGDIDPTIVQYLMNVMDMTAEETMRYLNTKSGVLGLSGVSRDFRDLFVAARAGNQNAETAIDIFCYRVKKYIGAYTAAMGNVDVIAFTGGIGENSAEIRVRIMADMEFLSIQLDHERNDSQKGERVISSDDSGVTVLVVPANEEMMIAKETYRLLKR